MSPFTLVANRIDRFVLPVVSRHALPILKREYDCAAAHQILWHAWSAFGQIAARIPALRPPGTRIKLSLAAASAALHRAMVHLGSDEQRATRIAAEIGARTYRRVARIPWWLARLVTLDSIARLPLAMRLFGWIGFAGRQQSNGNGSVVMEVHRCPIARFYDDLGIAHLSRALVCDLEVAVADEWEADLTRTHLGGDGDGCLLKLRSIAPQHGGRNAEQPVY